MTSGRRFVICFQQTRTDKNTQSFHILHLCAVIENANIVFSLGGWQRFGRKTNRWSFPPHQRRDASNMEMTHIQMQLSKPQNRWDLRAEANFPSKLKPSVLRWRLGYDRPTALGVHGWLVMEPTEMCVDRRDARNRRPDWEVTFLSYSWLWSVRADVFVRRVCVCVCVCVRSSDPRASAGAARCNNAGGIRHQHAPEARHQDMSHSMQTQPPRMSRSKNITRTNSRDGSFQVRQRILHRSVLTPFKHWMTSSRPREGNNDATSDYN